MNISELYPWQQGTWANWQHCMTQSKVPHALLLYGRCGCGVNDFALRLCCSLLCHSDNNSKPCLKCEGCRLFLAGNHPDYLMVEAEQDQIKVEQVRNAINFLQLSRHYPTYKVVFIKEVDKLNYAAANSLLKTLEEPPAESIILMSCRQPSTLTPTIRSRCHRIHIKEPGFDAVAWLASKLSISEELAKQKLRLVNNSPLMALEETSDKSDKLLFYDELDQWIGKQITTHDFVDHWCDKPAEEVQQWLLERLQHTITEQAKKVSLHQINPASTIKLLYWLHQRQIERCRFARQNINPRLLLEGGLLEWRKATRNH